jgi:hypothetical protein
MLQQASRMAEWASSRPTFFLKLADYISYYQDTQDGWMSQQAYIFF